MALICCSFDILDLVALCKEGCRFPLGEGIEGFMNIMNRYPISFLSPSLTPDTHVNAGRAILSL